MLTETARLADDTKRGASIQRLKMLRNLTEGKLLSNSVIIEDQDIAWGQDLLVSFLKQCVNDDSIKNINLICFENPPAFYLRNKPFSQEKIICHDYFTDPCGWEDLLSPGPNLRWFSSDPNNNQGNAFVIDSLSLLTHYHGFFNTYRYLDILKKDSKKILCLVHNEMFSPEQLEELSNFATTVIKVQGLMKTNHDAAGYDRLCEITFKKPGGKVIKQEEAFYVNDDFNVTSKVLEEFNDVTEPSVSFNAKEDIETLTTFNLGVNLSEKERNARDELKLPYLRSETENKTGEIIYQPDIDELEEDPDDDLDI